MDGIGRVESGTETEQLSRCAGTALAQNFAPHLSSFFVELFFQVQYDP